MNTQDDNERLEALETALRADMSSQRPLVGIVKIYAARNQPADIIRVAHELERNGQSGSADQVLAIGTRNLPDSLDVGVAHCQLAMSRGDLKAARARWMQLAKRMPHNIEAQLGCIDFLSEHGRAARAVDVADEALNQLGERAELMVALAENLEASGSWERAATVWQQICQRFPQTDNATTRAEAAQRRTDLIRASRLSVQPIELPSGPPAPIGAATREQNHALVMQFENLGHNCEFGLLQRRFGAEPVGLMRFSSIQPLGLLSLLWSGFAGMGDPSVMEIRDVGNEYRVRHPGSGWGMHTRIHPTKERDTSILREQCKHVGYLTRKLIDDLNEPEKVLVFQAAQLKDPEIDEIYAALQSYGPSRLLCVRLATDTHPAGCIEWRTDRLLIAAIDRPGRDRGGRGWDISVEWWLHFCRVALAGRASQQAAESAR